jgi:hypothetical protein
MALPSQPVAQMDEAQADGEAAYAEHHIDQIEHTKCPIQSRSGTSFRTYRKAMVACGGSYRNPIGEA